MTSPSSNSCYVLSSFITLTAILSFLDLLTPDHTCCTNDDAIIFVYKMFRFIIIHISTETRQCIADTTVHCHLSHIDSLSMTCTLQSHSYNCNNVKRTTAYSNHIHSTSGNRESTVSSNQYNYTASYNKVAIESMYKLYLYHLIIHMSLQLPTNLNITV